MHVCCSNSGFPLFVCVWILCTCACISSLHMQAVCESVDTILLSVVIKMNINVGKDF